MADPQVALDSDANEKLDDYVDDHDLGVTKKAVASAAVKEYVDDD